MANFMQTAIFLLVCILVSSFGSTQATSCEETVRDNIHFCYLASFHPIDYNSDNFKKCCECVEVGQQCRDAYADEADRALARVYEEDLCLYHYHPAASPPPSQLPSFPTPPPQPSPIPSPIPQPPSLLPPSLTPQPPSPLPQPPSVPSPPLAQPPSPIPQPPPKSHLPSPSTPNYWPPGCRYDVVLYNSCDPNPANATNSLASHSTDSIKVNYYFASASDTRYYIDVAGCCRAVALFGTCNQPEQTTKRGWYQTLQQLCS